MQNPTGRNITVRRFNALGFTAHLNPHPVRHIVMLHDGGEIVAFEETQESWELCPAFVRRAFFGPDPRTA